MFLNVNLHFVHVYTPKHFLHTPPPKFKFLEITLLIRHPSKFTSPQYVTKQAIKQYGMTQILIQASSVSVKNNSPTNKMVASAGIILYGFVGVG